MRMEELNKLVNPYGDDKEIAACGLFGVIDTSGQRFSGRVAMEAMANMHDRGNGLGGGFAAYGIYPEMANHYALHVMLEDSASRDVLENYLQQQVHIVHKEEIPTSRRRAARVGKPPLLWRYFFDLCTSGDHDCDDCDSRSHGDGAAADAAGDVAADAAGDVAGDAAGDALVEDQVNERLVRMVMHINRELPGAYVFSCARNMGVFKGVGYPEDIGEFFRLDEYDGYLWTGHNRFPTNTQAWWGGAHPFSLLDWTVVHNGEISSYGTNRRFLEMYGYHCTLHTDTEVIAYAVDLLIRRHALAVNEAAAVLAAPLWNVIDRLPEPARRRYSALRRAYAPLLLNGPFTVIIARQGEMIGLGDRIRLRPFVAATAGSRVYVASEEAPIRLVEPSVDRVWIPRGGEPVVARLQQHAGVELQAQLQAQVRAEQAVLSAAV